MDFPVDSINLPLWDPVQADERDDAFEKVENYLRACRVASRLHRARLAALLLQHAIRRRQEGAAAPLATLAIQEARTRMEEWMNTAFNRRDDQPPVSAAQSFLALYLCDGYFRWPNAFLDAAAPPELVDALRSGIVRAGPELQVSHMVPRAMDYGLLPELAGDAMEKLETAPLLKAAIIWAMILALMLGLFIYTRGLVS
jgi:hypothetical protein